MAEAHTSASQTAAIREGLKAPAKKATLIADDGTVFLLSIEGNDLCIHADGPPGYNPVLSYQVDAGNEGTVKARLITSTPPTVIYPRHRQLRDRP